MPALNRKLWRDTLGNAGTLIPVIAIIAVGTGMFVGMASSHRILTASQAAYYRAYRFADFWLEVKKAPLAAVEPLAEMPGVAALETRVVFDVILDVPDVVRPVTGRLISVPKTGFDRTINGVCLVRGSGFSDDRDEELILSEAFAVKHGLDPGDQISMILNRRRQTFVIVGTAISPEYVYMVRGQGDIAPDPEHFSICWLKQDYARDLLDFSDACNQIVGLVTTGTSEEEVESLLEVMERRLDPFGVLAKTPRERQASHRVLSDEIAGLGKTATILPTIFLLAAALVLNIVTSRLAERQRSVIGTLKALGYTDAEVLWHFTGFGVVVGGVGGLLGCGLGVVLMYAMITLYKTLFQFPTFTDQVYPDLLLLALGLSLSFAVGGTLRGVWGVLKLQPAESMRMRPPERGGAVFLERIPFLWRRLGFRSHLALRGVIRNPGRTLTGIFTTSIATTMILMTLMMSDSMRFLLEFQFRHIAHSDVDIGLQDERSMAGLFEARKLPAVDYAEPLLGVACDLRNGPVSRRLAITGLPPEHRLTTPMTVDLEPIEIPNEGLVLTRKLAEILNADVGDSLELTPVRGRRERVPVYVAAIVDGLLGLECYADLHYLSRLVGEVAAVNTVQTAINPARKSALYRDIKQLPNAQGISVREDTRRNIEKTFIETMNVSLSIMIGFAGVVAFGSMLNASLVELGDRIRDVSTFRVLGYNAWQVAAIFFRQNLVVFVLGVIAGLPMGYWMTVQIAKVYDTELFRMHVVVDRMNVVHTLLLLLGFMLIAQAVVYRQVRRLNWLEGIKVKE